VAVILLLGDERFVIVGEGHEPETARGSGGEAGKGMMGGTRERRGEGEGDKEEAPRVEGIRTGCREEGESGSGKRGKGGSEREREREREGARTSKSEREAAREEPKTGGVEESGRGARGGGRVWEWKWVLARLSLLQLSLLFCVRSPHSRVPTPPCEPVWLAAGVAYSNSPPTTSLSPESRPRRDVT
jgi:hypothetical protein